MTTAKPSYACCSIVIGTATGSNMLTPLASENVANDVSNKNRQVHGFR